MVGGGIAQCPIMNVPLISERNKGDKEKLQKIVEAIGKEHPEILNSTIVKLEEVK